jgi:type I restriction enzyme S subunit
MNAQQLKNSILQLAVQGKLVPNEPITNDQLRITNQEPITDDEKPFDIPDSWQWVRLREIGEYKKGPFGSSLTKSRFVPKSKDAVKVYEQKNAIQKNSSLGEYYISRQYFELKMRGFEVFPRDIIVSCAGTIGETYVMPDNIEQGIINQALMKMRITKNIDLNYFLIYFDYVLKHSAKKSSKGSAIKNIPPFTIFKNYPFPLPPFVEQKRIVAKIVELMPFVEKYDKVEKQLTALNTTFPDTLKKSILQYAMQGKLVKQNPNDKRVEIKGTTIKNDEKLFDIPDSWQWVRLGKIVSKLTDGTHKTPKYTEKGIPFLSVKDISSGNICFDNTKYISEKEHNELYKRCNPKKGDILLTKVGTTGIPVLIKTEKQFSLFVSVALLKYDSQVIDGNFFVYLLQSPLVGVQCKENTKGVGNKNWVMKDIANTLIVLPPLAEQKRIVAKIEELMSSVEKLKSKEV